MQIQEEDYKRAMAIVVAAWESSTLPKQVTDNGRTIMIYSSESAGVISMTDGQTNQPVIVSQNGARSSAQTEVTITNTVAFYIKYQTHPVYEVVGRISPWYGQRFTVKFDNARTFSVTDLATHQVAEYKIY